SERPQFLFLASLDDAVPDLSILQFPVSEADDLAPVSNDEHAFVLGDCCLNNCRHDHRFPGGCRCDKKNLSLPRCNQVIEFSDNVGLVWAEHRCVHGAPPATMSSAQPRGVDARPKASRSSACLMTSSGTPCCKASEQTTAESLAIESAVLPARPFPRKISARP